MSRSVLQSSVEARKHVNINIDYVSDGPRNLYGGGVTLCIYYSIIYTYIAIRYSFAIHQFVISINTKQLINQTRAAECFYIVCQPGAPEGGLMSHTYHYVKITLVQNTSQTSH